MAFDAGMLASSVWEISQTLLEGRIEKINQPERDEVILQIHAMGGTKKLLLNAGPNNPRMGITEVVRDNPPSPLPFCIMLRKYLSGAKLQKIVQPSFERVAVLTFETRDSMGYIGEHTLVAEIMGKYSNLILLNEEKKIIGTLRPVDLTVSSVRPLITGMTYEMPPAQKDKCNPLDVTKETFVDIACQNGNNRPAWKWLTATFMGLSAGVAKEMVYRAGLPNEDEEITPAYVQNVWHSFDEIIGSVKTGAYAPSVVFRDAMPVEYAYVKLTQYAGLRIVSYSTVGEALDAFFENRDREARIKQRATDITHAIGHAEARLTKKIALQEEELEECRQAYLYKKQGDLLTSHLYKMTKGLSSVMLEDYEKEPAPDGRYPLVSIDLDPRLTPSANAQKKYKKYTKLRNARQELAKQIAISREELDYLGSVNHALHMAQDITDLTAVRDELAEAGYMSRAKDKHMVKHTGGVGEYLSFQTQNGYKVLCGKNNLQNEYITHKLAEKTDYWFHVKGAPGSHVVMLCKGQEPDASDFTEAAEIAAYHSSLSQATNIAVDYTKVRELKKAPGAKPGFVVYHTNWSAYVTPHKEKIEAMKLKTK